MYIYVEKITYFLWQGFGSKYKYYKEIWDKYQL